MTANLLELLRQDAVYALAGESGSLYAARTSGLYRSTDGGVRWTPVPTGQGNGQPVTAVAVRDNAIVAARGGTILSSDDGGASWRESALALPLPTVTALALTSDAMVAATAQDGVFVSTDGGRWVAWNYGLIDLNVNALALSSDGRSLWIGTESGLFRSVNGGRSWREVDFPAEAAPVLSVVLTSDTALAGTDRGLWRSDDGGASWQRVEAVTSAVQAMQTHSDSVWLLLDDQLMRSDDGGASWQSDSLPEGKMSTALLPTAQAVIVGFADGDLMAVAQT